MKMRRLFVAMCLMMSVAALPAFAEPEPRDAKEGGDVRVVPLVTKSFPDIPGKEGAMLTVELLPGVSSLPHRHRAHTFVYVLEGTIRMQVKGGPVETLVAGQTFYESPGDIHALAENASATQRAKFVVFFVKDEGHPTVMPVP